MQAWKWFKYLYILLSIIYRLLHTIMLLILTICNFIITLLLVRVNFKRNIIINDVMNMRTISVNDYYYYYASVKLYRRFWRLIHKTSRFITVRIKDAWLYSSSNLIIRWNNDGRFVAFRRKVGFLHVWGSSKFPGGFIKWCGVSWRNLSRINICIEIYTVICIYDKYI